MTDNRLGRRGWSWLAVACLVMPATTLARTSTGVGFSAVEVPGPLPVPGATLLIEAWAYAP